MKKLLLRYTFYSLILAVTFGGAYFCLESQKIKVQEEYARQVVQMKNSLLHIEATIVVDSARRVAVKKISLIISKYNSDLDNQTRQKYANEIYAMTVKYDNLDIDLISATITHESARTWDATIVSPAGAKGLMQIMPATGRILAKEAGIEWTNNILFDPIKNIRLGSRYLSMLITKYSKVMDREFAVEAALAAYNGGEARVAFWIKRKRKYRFLYKETQTYIPRVLGLYEKFSAITM